MLRRAQTCLEVPFSQMGFQKPFSSAFHYSYITVKSKLKFHTYHAQYKENFIYLFIFLGFCFL